ncbi:Hypothetical protein FKW44_003963 [Caligus rogercresseyi]|uniref:Uncharacterized protein n=1 Tax=Caligus rogercresseyi TaxID=217165 RepID=A0A7T8HL80_CALRO|nr:Hypothetical protein FKW44_003963 [Caligus rogercresseyi]
MALESEEDQPPISTATKASEMLLEHEEEQPLTSTATSFLDLSGVCLCVFLHKFLLL